MKHLSVVIVVVALAAMITIPVSIAALNDDPTRKKILSGVGITEPERTTEPIAVYTGCHTELRSDNDIVPLRTHCENNIDFEFNLPTGLQGHTALWQPSAVYQYGENDYDLVFIEDGGETRYKVTLKD
jgi:hypothetical protein